MNNTTIFNRALHSSGNTYTCITNKLLQDKNLSYADIGIMAHILSHSNGYVINTTHLQKQHKIPEKKFELVIKKLIKLGYLNKVRVFGGISWNVNEMASQTPTESIKGNSTARTGTASVDIINKNANIELIQPQTPTESIKGNSTARTGTGRTGTARTSAPLISNNETSNKEINKDKINNLCDGHNIGKIFPESILDSSSSVNSKIELTINPIELKTEVDNYTPSYFIHHTQDYLNDYYIQFKFKLQYQDNPININQFEKVLVTKLQSQYQMIHYDKPVPNLPDILNWVLQDNPIQVLADIRNHIQIMKKNMEWVSETLFQLTPVTNEL